MSNRFIHKNENLFAIPISKFITGIIIGIGYAFTFYSLLYLTRESFRIFSAQTHNDVWILSDAEVNVYNLFFAFISVIFGQNICFTYWFNKPKKFFSKIYLRQTTIVNDQRAFTWYFLLWFSSLSICFGILFGTSLWYAQYVFSFYPKFNCLFILIIIVFYFQSWSNIRLTYRRKSLKWLLTSFFIVTALSFGLSRVNVIDYKAINEKYIQNNIYYKYILELPESNSGLKLEKRSLIEDIYIVMPKNKQEVYAEPIIVIDKQEIAIEELGQKISELLMMRPKGNRMLILFNFHVHKEVKANFIKRVFRELSEEGVSKISFAVVPVNPQFDQRYYTEQAFKYRIQNYNYDSTLYQELFNSLEKYSNQIEINGFEINGCFVNNAFIEYADLTESLIRQIALDTNFIISLHIDNKTNFSSYIKVITSASEAIMELRNLYSLKRYSSEYYYLEPDEQSKISEKYPVRIFELNESF